MKRQTKKSIAIVLFLIIITLAVFGLFQIAVLDTVDALKESNDNMLEVLVDSPNWTHQKTTIVQIMVKDPDQVGINRVEYRIDNGKWKDAPDDLNVSIEKDCNFGVRTTNSAGVMTITNKYLQCFDQTTPELVNVLQQGDSIIIMAKDDLSGVYSAIINEMEYISQTDGSVIIPQNTLDSLSLKIQIKDVAQNISDMKSFSITKSQTSFSFPSASPSSDTQETTILEPDLEEEKTSSLFDGILSGKSAESKAKKQVAPLSGLINTVIIFGACALIGFVYLFIKNKRTKKEYDDKDFIMYENDDEKEIDPFETGGIIYEA